MTLAGGVKQKWSESEGIYTIGSSLVNGKPYWHQKSPGKDANLARVIDLHQYEKDFPMSLTVMEKNIGTLT